MMKVTIYENEGIFDIHNEGGKLIKSGFTSESEAVYYCKKNNFAITDIYFAVA